MLNLIQPMTYTLPEEHPIWVLLGERLMFYLRDMNYDFVES
jgi:hypothetical protein